MEVLSPLRGLDPTAGWSTSSVPPLVLVVGYDGSLPARHALNGAVELLGDRDGVLEVVYVAHRPVVSDLVPEALAAVLHGLDEQARTLSEDVRARLRGQRQPWHFHRRYGAVSAELIAVAEVLRRRYGDAVEVAIVVGGSAHRYHHVIGSVGSSIVRSDQFPVVVVP